MFEVDIYKYRRLLEPLKNNDCFSLISRSIYTRNIESTLFLVNQLFSQDLPTVEHPDLEGVVTVPRGNKLFGMWNVIFFSDITYGNKWFCIQSTSFIDIIVTEQSIFFIAKNPSVQIYNSIVKILEFANSSEVWRRHPQNAYFGVGQLTPFHFFYDQFKFLPYIEKARQGVYRSGNPIFFDTKALNIELLESVDVGTVLFYPTIITQNWCNALGFGGSDKQQKTKNLTALSSNFLSSVRVKEAMTKMEDAILDFSLKKPVTKEKTFRLWIGITSAKRAWVDQVNNYVSIINKLAGDFPQLEVIVDGVTSSLESQVETTGDLEIYEQIRELVDPKVLLRNIIGLKYEEKVLIGNTCFAFIANGGTGCLVPLRICKLPGVIHTNSRLLSFPDTYEQNVAILEGADFKDSESVDSISYELDWEAVYSALLSRIQKGKQ